MRSHPGQRAWTLAETGQVWTLRPGNDPVDGLPGMLCIVLRRRGDMATTTVEDAWGQRRTLPLCALVHYQLDQ
ncbi:hypothetical protein [Streptomyces triculaminicus]|uniref:hypothetical protein n=1 Tax=Streptomyces triculaminicus TaxID=2816232 RepID=UPI0037CCF1EA